MTSRRIQSAAANARTPSYTSRIFSATRGWPDGYMPMSVLNAPNALSTRYGSAGCSWLAVITRVRAPGHPRAQAPDSRTSTVAARALQAPIPGPHGRPARRVRAAVPLYADAVSRTRGVQAVLALSREPAPLADATRPLRPRAESTLAHVRSATRSAQPLWATRSGPARAATRG